MAPWAELAFREYALAKLMDGGTFQTATLSSPVASRGAPSMTTLPWAHPGDAVDACTLTRTPVKLTVVASSGADPAGLCSDGPSGVRIPRPNVEPKHQVVRLPHRTAPATPLNTKAEVTCGQVFRNSVWCIMSTTLVKQLLVRAWYHSGATASWAKHRHTARR